MSRWLDLHCHSYLSSDGVSRPAVLLRAARAAGLDALAVTDHGTIQGGLRTAALRGPSDPEIIIGAEYSTDVGHVLGLFLRDEIRLGAAPRWPVAEVIGAIHEQGGLAILAHPTKTFQPLPMEALGSFDGIEVYNARAEFSRFPQANSRALEHWRAWQRLHPDRSLIATAGSDAHFPGEVGHARCAVDGDGDLRQALSRGPERIIARGTAPIVEASSQAVKVWKTHQWARAPQAAGRLLWHAARTAGRVGHLSATTTISLDQR